MFRVTIRLRTYTSCPTDDGDTSITVINDNVLHGPSPIPVDLDSGLSLFEVETTSRELLVAHVCSSNPMVSQHNIAYPRTSG